LKEVGVSKKIAGSVVTFVKTVDIFIRRVCMAPFTFTVDVVIEDVYKFELLMTTEFIDSIFALFMVARFVTVIFDAVILDALTVDARTLDVCV
jgi:hypothetical protein